MNIKKALPFLILLVWTLFSCSPKGYDFRFFSIGDMPYHLPDDLGRFDRVISSLNHERPAFTVHVGDFKTGSSPCDEDYFLSIRDYFQQFQHPLFYTPGDNEWTDCHRVAAGGYDPIERLAKVRELFYTDTGSLSGSGMDLITQSTFAEYGKFVENRLWKHKGITFGTLHIVGSNNNFKTDSAANNVEYNERDKANSFWLEEIFRQAKASKSDGVVIFLHAGLVYSDDESNGFKNFVMKLREEAMAFEKPILMVYGDHHKFKIEKPLTAGDGKVLTNFTSLMVFGDHDMHAVEIRVNKKYDALFEIRQYFVKGN